MNIYEFRSSRINGREKLLNKILDVFLELKPVAIYQFGSGASNYKDEFSDLDIWVVFNDEKIENIIKNQSKIFKSIAQVLVKHKSKSWAPKEGSATQIIYKTKFGLFQVDFYISKDSKKLIIPAHKVLYGKEMGKIGNIIVNKKIKDSHTIRKDINLLLCLMFIGIKGIVRNWKDKEFAKNLNLVHKRLQNNYENKMNRRRVILNFKYIYRLLNDLKSISNKSQKITIKEIGEYTKLVETLYS